MMQTQFQEKMINWTNFDPKEPEKRDQKFILSDKDGITTALAESLKKKCETNGLVTQIFLGSIDSVA